MMMHCERTYYTHYIVPRREKHVCEIKWHKTIHLDTRGWLVKKLMFKLNVVQGKCLCLRKTVVQHWTWKVGRNS